MVVRKGYGNECSLMIATRAPGYHTKPHQHESEQINYVMDGEIWFFVKDKGFHCKKGDFQRIPANTIHWAWNRSDKDATVAEAHAPGLIGGRAGENAVALFDDGETPQVRGPGVNQFVPYRPRQGRSEVLRQIAMRSHMAAKHPTQLLRCVSVLICRYWVLCRPGAVGPGAAPHPLRHYDFDGTPAGLGRQGCRLVRQDRA